MNEIEHLVSSQNKLGETPIWSPEENALYWVDWGGQPSCRFEPATGKDLNLPMTVRWTEGVEAMLRAGVDTFYEVGPGTVLGGLVKRVARGFHAGVVRREEPDLAGFRHQLLLDDDVGRLAESRVRGHARPAVGTTALEGDDKLRSGNRLACCLVRFW